MGVRVEREGCKEEGRKGGGRIEFEGGRIFGGSGM